MGVSSRASSPSGDIIMRIEHHLESLSASAEALSSLSISHPKSFQNTLLSRVSITQVIRDAEAHESSLFTSDASLAAKLPDTGAAEILKSRDSSLEVLLAAVDKVMTLYPINVEETRRQVDLMRHKSEALRDSINSLEGEVDDQRRRLDEMNVDRGSYPEDEQNHVVTEEMVAAEEREIARIEQEIETRTRR